MCTSEAVVMWSMSWWVSEWVCTASSTVGGAPKSANSCWSSSVFHMMCEWVSGSVGQWVYCVITVAVQWWRNRCSAGERGDLYCDVSLSEGSTSEWMNEWVSEKWKWEVRSERCEGMVRGSGWRQHQSNRYTGSGSRDSCICIVHPAGIGNLSLIIGVIGPVRVWVWECVCKIFWPILTPEFLFCKKKLLWRLRQRVLSKSVPPFRQGSATALLSLYRHDVRK
jgi:hypothetical protein